MQQQTSGTRSLCPLCTVDPGCPQLVRTRACLFVTSVSHSFLATAIGLFLGDSVLALFHLQERASEISPGIQSWDQPGASFSNSNCKTFCCPQEFFLFLKKIAFSVTLPDQLLVTAGRPRSRGVAAGRSQQLTNISGKSVIYLLWLHPTKEALHSKKTKSAEVAKGKENPTNLMVLPMFVFEFYCPCCRGCGLE